MVTRIESGRIQLNAPGGVPMERVVPPQTDFMAAAREQARGAGVQADIIDRMSQFLFGVAKERAGEEAIKYLAENPPDIKQILIGSGFDPATGEFTGVPTNKKKDASIPWTAFDKVYQKARDEQIANLLKAEGVGQIANLVTRLDKEGVGQLSSSQIATKIENLITGFENAAKQESPAAALQVRASLAAHGYTVIEKARQLEFKVETEKRLIKIDQSIEDESKMLTESFKSTPETALIKTDGFVKDIMSKAYATNNKEFIDQTRKRVNEIVSQAKIDAVSAYVVDPEFSPNSLAAVRKLDAGDAGALSGVWASMSFSEKAKVRDGLRSVFTDRVTAEERNRDEAHRNNLSIVNVNVQRLIASDGKDAEAESILLSISYKDPTAISPRDIATIKKQAADKEEPAFGALIEMKKHIFNDKYVNVEQMKADARRMGVSDKFIYSDLQPFFVSRKDRAETLLYQGITRVAESEAGSMNDKRRQRTRMSIEQEVNDRFADPANTKTKSEILKEVQTERAQSNASAIIKSRVKSANDLYGKNSPDPKVNIIFDENTDIDELADQARRGKNKLQDIDIEILRSEYAVIKKQIEILNPIRQKPAGAR